MKLYIYAAIIPLIVNLSISSLYQEEMISSSAFLIKHLVEEGKSCKTHLIDDYITFTLVKAHP